MRRTVPLALLGALLAIACQSGGTSTTDGGGTDRIAGDGGDTAEAATPATPREVARVDIHYSRDGATLSGEGFRLVVPPNSVPDSTSIILEVMEGGTWPRRALGTVYRVRAVNWETDEPIDPPFAPVATVAISYAGQSFPPGVRSAYELAASRLEGNDWVDLDGRGVHIGHSELRGQTGRLATFALTTPPPSGRDPAPRLDGDGGVPDARPDAGAPDGSAPDAPDAGAGDDAGGGER